MHSDGSQELALRGPCFVAVFLRVEIERRLNSRMTQDALHCLRLDLRLVHQPVAERVTQVVKSEPLALLNLHARRFRCRPEMVSNKYGRGERHATMRLEGRKDEIRVLRVGRLAAPSLQMIRQDGCKGT